MPHRILLKTTRPLFATALPALCATALRAVVVGLIITTGSRALAGQPCEVLYVAKGHTNPANDGSSWANAFCDDTALADGIAAAAARIDGPNPPPCIDVYVAAGVYKPSDSGASFAMHDKVHLYGGFKVGDDFSMRQTGCLGGDNAGRPCETAADCPSGTCDLERVTIISGDINDDDGAECYVDADCGGTNLCVAQHCAIWPNFGPLVKYDQAGNCTLNGFVLRSAYSDLGSAVRIVGEVNVCPPVGPVLRNCLVRQNYTGAWTPNGGAVSNEYAGTIIEGCLFSGNEAYDGGGALHSHANHLQVRDSVFENNHSILRTGAVYLPRTNSPNCPDTAINTFERCRFKANSAFGGGSSDGGALESNGQLVLSDCKFEENSGSYTGALGLSGYSVVERCEFVANTSEWAGAIATGQFNTVIVRDCTFVRNAGEVSGAIDANYLTIEGSRFFENAGDFAGAVSTDGWSHISDTIFAGNRRLGGYYSFAGAAIFVNADGELLCERCRFFGNSGAHATVTVYAGDATFIDTLFAGNASPALSLDVEEAKVDLLQCTLAKNSPTTAFGTIHTSYLTGTLPSSIKAKNSILWDNAHDGSAMACTEQIDCGQTCGCASCAPDSPCFECRPSVTVDVNHSNIEHPSCIWPGAGNINEDPMFVRNDIPRDCDGNGWGDPQCAAGPCMPGVTGCDDYGDFRLRHGSPAINAGNPNAEDLPATDLDGNPRVAGCPDMGAYELVGGGDCCTDEDCAPSGICCANVCSPDIDSDADTVPDCHDLCPGEDDRVDADQNGTPDCAQFQAIPTVSTWGLLILALTLLVAAKVRPSPVGRANLARGF